MNDYDIARADEALLARLPWPTHGLPQTSLRKPRADVHHAWFRADADSKSSGATGETQRAMLPAAVGEP